MRAPCLFLPMLLVAALAAAPALGATTLSKLKGRSAPVSDAAAAADLPLRGALQASKPGGVKAIDAPVSRPDLDLPAPGAGLSVMARAGLSTPPSITPLRPIGDPAPLCRSGCAETRYTCAAGDDADCDSKWSQCVAACSTPSLR